MSDNNSDMTGGIANGRIPAGPASTRSTKVSEWDAPLWDDAWEGQTGLFGDAHLCVATKKWADGTVDVLVAHDPYAEDGMPTVYAHRHRGQAAPLTIHGRADEVIKTVTTAWGPPQESKTEFLDT